MLQKIYFSVFCLKNIFKNAADEGGGGGEGGTVAFMAPLLNLPVVYFE